MSLLLSLLYQGYDFFRDLNSSYVWHAVVKDEYLVKVRILVLHDMSKTLFDWFEGSLTAFSLITFDLLSFEHVWYDRNVDQLVVNY